MEFSAVSKLENGHIVTRVTTPQANGSIQYAYYLYEKERGVLEKRWYTNENTCMFSPPASGEYFVRAYIRWKETAESEYTIEAKSTNKVIFYPTKHLGYEELEGESFRSQDGSFYDILWDGVHYEFFIHNQPDNPNAIVLGTGYVGNRPRPYLSRISWAKTVPGTAIYYSDPTSYMPPCTLGWGYGTSERWYLEDIAILLHKILGKLGIKQENTLFYGSSGGGFTSILLASMFHSRATVINPQFIVENYEPEHISRMKQACLKQGESLLPERVRAVHLFQRTGYVPLLHVVQNTCSTRDIRDQIPAFLMELCQSGIDCGDRLWIEFYTDAGGHNAMPPSKLCLRQIAEDLARPLPPAPEYTPGPDGFLSRFYAAVSEAE